MDVRAIEPVTVLKTKSARLIRAARQSGGVIVITQNGRPAVVLQDVEAFQRQREALLLLKLFAKGTSDLRAGKGISHTKARKRIEARLRELERG